ncbi:hypothetical protein [Shimia biformata]|uniref:hypothetical protein n=1 Tax=Shimia biformata TaxID=1294299 RepID=UPI00194F0F25|nr:hypothetical protein [Shimia biformata]
MTGALAVSEHETGRVRVFGFEPRPGEVEFLKTEDRVDGAAVAHLFGVAALDGGHVDLFRMSEIADLGLAGFLIDGAGVPEDQVAPHAPALDQAQGVVIVLYSRAFGGTATQLVPDPRLMLLGDFQQAKADFSFDPLPSAATVGSVSRAGETRTPANPHLTLIAALVALPVVALIVGAILWGVLR